MKYHCMLDLETMGTDPGCAILSIGAVKFNPVTGAIGEYFYANVDLLSCLMKGLRVDPKTQDWWIKPENYEAFLRLGANPVVLHMALSKFSDFYKNDCHSVWSNGPAADVVWMEAAYRACGMECPWDHRAPRCYRTIVDLADLKREERAVPAVRHDAEADARAQAIDVIKCYERLNLRDPRTGSATTE